MSFEAFVKSTNLEEVSPLSPGGQPLFRSHDVLERELSRRLSSDHAKFFAEPEISESSDRVDWYGSGKDLRKLTSLDAPDQSKARRKIASLFDDISKLSDELEASENSDERYLARLLSQALRIPSDDSIYVGTEGPLITDWGTVARGAPTEYHVLKILRDKEEVESAPPSAPGAGSEPLPGRPPNGDDTVPADPPRGGYTRIPAGLYIGSLLATIILVPIILALLLSSCGVTLPGFLSSISGRYIFSYCENNTKQDTLINLISSYEREIQRKQKACGANQDTAQVTHPPGPADPSPPSIQGIVSLKDIEPPVGNMCAIAICASGLSTDPEDPECARSNAWKENLVSGIPDGYCRALIFPIQFSVDPGTTFSARYEVLADNDSYRVFNIEAETFSQHLLDVLKRNGHPRLYWVADFPWPPEETATDNKGAD